MFLIILLAAPLAEVRPACIGLCIGLSADTSVRQSECTPCTCSVSGGVCATGAPLRAVLTILGTTVQPVHQCTNASTTLVPTFVSRRTTLTPQGAGSLAAGLAGLPTRGESQPVRTRGSPKDGALAPARRTSEATAEQLASNPLPRSLRVHGSPVLDNRHLLAPALASRCLRFPVIST